MQENSDTQGANSQTEEPGAKQTGFLAQVLNPNNLALLKQGDRFVIMAAGLIVVAALGAATVIETNARLQAGLAMFSMVVVAALVVLVQWRSISYKGIEADLVNQSSAAESINGDWWQIVYSDEHPGLSYIRFAISGVAEKHALQGISFNSEGQRRARFSSDAIAIKSTTPVEIYYVWRGTKLKHEDSRMIEGFGRFRFDSVGREQKPMEAEGTFTEGCLSEFKFENPRTVELIRLSDDDSKLINKDFSQLSELAKKAFESFKLDKNRSFPVNE